MLIGFLFNPLAATANNNPNKDYDSIFFHISVTVAAQDIDKAISLADSLFLTSKTKHQQINSLMLKSSLHQQKGNVAEAIDIARDANELATKEKLYDWQARTSGFLASQYRRLNMYGEGKSYLEAGIAVSDRISDDDLKYSFLGSANQERAYYNIEINEYHKAYENTKEAETHYNKLEEGKKKTYLLATNNELQGKISIELMEWDKSLEHYHKAIELLELISQEESTLGGKTLCGLGIAYLEKGEIELAGSNLKIAEEITEKSDDIFNKVRVYEWLAKYYKEKGDSDLFYHYIDLHNQTYAELQRLKRESIDSFVQFTKLKNKKSKRNKNLFIGLSIILSLTIIAITIFYRIKTKRDYQRFKEVMRRMSDDHQLTESESESKEQISNKTIEDTKHSEDDKRLMSIETEKMILNKLKSFESSKKFLDRNISLSKLAGQLGTNTKYLSHILNSHKGQNFSNYINELRVKYIIQKLNKEPEFRLYKISYLAKECGYSSHSKFSVAFKSVTGLSPSIFLEQLKKDEVMKSE